MELIDLDLIDEPSWSCKEFDDVRFRKLCSMIKIYGQCRSICVREYSHDSFAGGLRRYQVLEGRNIIKALRTASIPLALVHNVGPVDDVTAMQISLMLNELEFQTDFVEVASLVNKVVDESHIQNAVNHSMFDVREIKKFRKIFDFNWNDFHQAKKSGKLSLFESQLVGDAKAELAEELESTDLKPDTDALQEDAGA